MKVRLGFVSNSSSVSFCIYGICDEGPIETREEIAYKAGLEINFGEDSECYIGRSWKSIKDNETGKQFKADVENKLKQAFQGEKLSFDTFEVGYYNG